MQKFICLGYVFFFVFRPYMEIWGKVIRNMKKHFDGANCSNEMCKSKAFEGKKIADLYYGDPYDGQLKQMNLEDFRNFEDEVKEFASKKDTRSMFYKKQL